MTLTDVILPVVSGVVFVVVLLVILYGAYFILKLLGITKLFKKKPKISDEVYIEVIKKIRNNETFDEIMEKTSKYPLRRQQEYLDAYLKVKNLN